MKVEALRVPLRRLLYRLWKEGKGKSEQNLCAFLFQQECNGTIDERAAFSGNREVIFREPLMSFPECLSFLSEGEAE